MGARMLGAIRQGAVRQPGWIFGTDRGIQVWTVNESRRITASILVGPQPIVLLNQHVVGTAREGEALSWALERVHDAVNGFYVLMADGK